MRINGYRCDGCGKEHLLDPFYRISKHGDSLPDEWFMLASASMEQPRFFCTLSCLHLWGQSPAERQAPLEAEDKKRMLFMLLIQDFLRENDRTNGFIHARSRTLQEIFALRFPDTPKLTETIEALAETSSNIWRYTFLFADDEHIAWAEKAKECGLIDHYTVSEVPA